MRLGFCGSMSVGKSTLVKSLGKLSEFKDYKIFTERSKYLRDLGIPLNTDSTIYGQNIFAAERVSELTHKNMITDRTLIDVIAFTELAKSINPYQKSTFHNYWRDFVKDYDYIFYIPCVGLPIEDNGVREVDPVYREKIDIEIYHIYQNFKWHDDQEKFYQIQGTNEERIAKIKAIVFS